MLTLTKASEETKEILKWGGLFLIGLVISFILLQVFLFVKNMFFPTPPPKPTVSFGVLPYQTFPGNVTDKKLTYSLNTLTGFTPNLQGQTKVYKTVQPVSDLLALSRTQAMVRTIGFNSNPIALSSRTFEWSTSESKDIKIDIINHNFVFTYPYLNDQGVLSTSNLDVKQAIPVAQAMLSNMDLFSKDIDVSKTKVISYSIKDGKLVPPTSLYDTQLALVSFVQADIDNLPVYYTDPSSSSMNFLVGSGKVLGGNFLHQTLAADYGTYPVKTSAQAYKDLQDGKGYIAKYYGSSSNIVIRNVFLAYYMSGNLQQYLMPIFVFQGDNGFYAYISAITDEWISK